MRNLAIFLACCVVALGAFILLQYLREPRQRPVLVIEDGRPGDDRQIGDILRTCPGVILGFSPNVDGTNYYQLQMAWRVNQWEGMLFQDAAEQEYIIWASSGLDYNALLRAACSRLRDDERYSWPGMGLPAASDAERYDLHDLRNGSLATSAILDRKTGRVWIWSKCSDCKGPEKSSFVEEKLVPTPRK
jgi:hypothetical protein